MLFKELICTLEDLQEPLKLYIQLQALQIMHLEEVSLSFTELVILEASSASTNVLQYVSGVISASKPSICTTEAEHMPLLLKVQFVDKHLIKKTPPTKI